MQHIAERFISIFSAYLIYKLGSYWILFLNINKMPAQKPRIFITWFTILKRRTHWMKYIHFGIHSYLLHDLQCNSILRKGWRRFHRKRTLLPEKRCGRTYNNLVNNSNVDFTPSLAIKITRNWHLVQGKDAY